MPDLFSELVEKELLKGLPASPDGETDIGAAMDLCRVLEGIFLLRTGALLAGVRAFSQVREWYQPFIDMVSRTVPRDLLINALAEAIHGLFEPEYRPGLLFGAILGPDVSKAYRFYEESSRFITRVVGIHHHQDPRFLKRLKPGQPVFLVREPENEYDPDAIAVRDMKGNSLGYLRATIARQLAPAMDRGTRYLASIHAVLDERFASNERVYIWVDKEGG